MSPGVVSSWVGVSPRAGLSDRIGSSEGHTAAVFGGVPLSIEILPPETRRVPRAAIRRCLDLLGPVVGASLADVDLLLVFAGGFATAYAQRFVAAVDDDATRVRPSDSTDMETSESLRGALADLGDERPRSALVVASPFDAALAASLSAGARTAIVVRVDLHGPRPEDCDVRAACVVRHPEGEDHG